MSNRGAPPFALAQQVRNRCLCLQLHRAARAAARAFDDVFRPLGLTSGQFSLLMSLNRPDPPTITNVAEVLAMDRTTLTANLKPLARRRLVHVGVDPEDRRSRRIVLSPAGRALLAKTVPIWEETLASLEARLGPARARRLRGDLAALT